MQQFIYEPDSDELNYFNFHMAMCNCVSAHFHRSTEILFVREGSMRVAINGVDRLLKEGDISIANGYDVHYYQSAGNSSVYILLFGDNYFNEQYLGGKRFENFLPASAKRIEIFRLLDFYYENVKDPNPLLKQGLVSSVLGLIVEQNGMSDKKRDENSIFAEVLSYIDAHYMENLKLDTLASRFGYTKNYFSMLFNRLTGKHFREYLNELRIEKMNKTMMGDKKMTVTYAALSSGFGSLNSYYRAVLKKKS